MTVIAFAGCGEDKTGETSPPGTKVVTADIQAGIEKYIEEQTRLNEGYYKLPFRDRDLRLKLVRVHTEYLANLGPRRHFACVDLAGTDGEVYDVDFFLAGDPDSMAVTETTLHKINGQPQYAWEQKRNGTWRRVPVKTQVAGFTAFETKLPALDFIEMLVFFFGAKLIIAIEYC